MAILNNCNMIVLMFCIPVMSDNLTMDTMVPEPEYMTNDELFDTDDYVLSDDAKFELIYREDDCFAQSIRFLLTYMNKKFNDVRYDKTQWTTNKIEMPFHNTPVLIINDNDDIIKLNKSTAICRYLADYAKIDGSNDWERYLIDSVVDDMQDLQRDFKKHIYMENDNLSGQLKKHFIDNQLPIYLKKFDNIVKQNNGHFVLGELTWADIFFVGMIDTINDILGFNTLAKYTNLIKLRTQVRKLNNISNLLKIEGR